MKKLFLKFLILPSFLISASVISFGSPLSVTAKRHHHKRHQDPVSIETYGAVADNPNIDNSPFILKALTSSNDVLIPAKTYYIRHAISLKNVNNKSITADGATIINQNYDESFFVFTLSNGIKIHGGYYTRPELPKVQDNKNQHSMAFNGCKNIIVTKVHINRSPEMGIGLNVVIGGVFSDNIIEHCLRDGIYAHYSGNLKYLNNTINDIKDDALSMHDYGIESERGPLHAVGYSQAGHSEISGNTITNAVEGIASIGCTELVISNNNIKNTVNAGINVFNSEKLYPGGDARVNNIKITGNTLDQCGVKVIINDLPQTNGGQIGSGRAAIFIGNVPTGADNDFRRSKLRLANIIVANNIVTNSAVNGITATNVDNLTVTGNSLTDCHSDTKNAPEYTGNIVELFNCTHILVRDNSVVDDRSTVLHNNAYALSNCTGIFQKGNDRGWRKSALSSVGSTVRQN